jgi:uncharacterized protein YegJ (DUF2314 family)
MAQWAMTHSILVAVILSCNVNKRTSQRIEKVLQPSTKEANVKQTRQDNEVNEHME